MRTVEVNNSDLIYRPNKVDDGKNAYIALLPILAQIKEQSLVDPIKQLTESEKSFDYIKAKQIRRKYSSSLLLFSDALSLDLFQVPPMETYLGKIKGRSYTKGLMFLYYLELLNAKTLLHEGRMKEAAEEILRLYRYGYLVQNSDGKLLYFMLGTVIKGGALNLIQEWAAKSHFGSGYYKNFLVRAEKYADNQALAKSLRIEYTSAADTLKYSNLIEASLKEVPEYKIKIEELKKYPLRKRFIYNESATINEVAAYYRQEIKNVTGGYIDVKHKEIYRPANSLTQYLNLLSGNPMGKLLLQIMMPRLNTRVERKFQLDARCNLTTLLLALRAYYADNKELPPTLKELVPNYIDKIPQDPFDNTGLKYSRANKKIYSVGSDMKDDKGSESEDLVVELNF